MFLTLIVLMSGLLSQAPQTPAPTPAPQPVAAAPAVAIEPDRANDIVCRSEIATGRRVPRRVCRSRAQMQAEAAAGQEALRRAQENNRPLRSN